MTRPKFWRAAGGLPGRADLVSVGYGQPPVNVGEGDGQIIKGQPGQQEELANALFGCHADSGPLGAFIGRRHQESAHAIVKRLAYSTVTDFARFLGWSTSRSLSSAM